MEMDRAQHILNNCIQSADEFLKLQWQKKAKYLLHKGEAW